MPTPNTDIADAATADAATADAYTAWQAERVAALARDATRRAGATIRPLQLLQVDPVHVLAAEPVDPFWRTPPPPRPAPLPLPEPAAPPASEEALLAQVSGLAPMPDFPGEVQVARRWWQQKRDMIPELFCQAVTVRPRPDPQPGTDVHTDLAGLEEEIRAWALLALDEAGIDTTRWQVHVRITEWWAVPAAERAGVPFAPNALTNPDPVFAALDEVEDEQELLQRVEVRRVRAAVAAWRAAQAKEADPTASNTPYQQGFFLDLGLKLKVADSTAKILVHTAVDLQVKTPETWGLFLAGRVPWRAMQRVHAALDGLAAAVLPDFDREAAVKVLEIPVPALPAALRRLAERLQPATADDRHETAMARRHYRIEAAADGMGWLSAYLPMVDLLGMDRQVTRQAITAHGKDGETRGIGAVKADLLRDGLRGFFRTDADPDDDTLLVKGRKGVEARVAVLIPAMTALGHSDAPAILQGYGPIGIRTALKLAGEAKSWIRVLTDPFTGAILNLDRKRYRPSKDMRALIRLLDGGGRSPGCPRGPDDTDIDHVRSYNLHDEHGTTAIDNLMLLSRTTHGGKTAGQLKATLLKDRTVIWETTAGNRYVTRPHDPLQPTPIPTEHTHPDDCPF